MVMEMEMEKEIEKEVVVVMAKAIGMGDGKYVEKDIFSLWGLWKCGVKHRSDTKKARCVNGALQ